MGRLSLFLFLLFSAYVSAEDYYWTHTSTGIGVRYNSAAEACLQGYGNGSCPTGRNMYPLREDGTLFQCQVRIGCNPSNAFAAAGRVSRYGDRCPEGTEFNVATGSCDPIPEPEPNGCEDTFGDIEYHLSPSGKTRASPTDPWPDGDVNGDPNMCSGGCRYQLAQSSSVSCGSLKGGSLLTMYCLFKYSGMGQACQGDPDQFFGNSPPVPPVNPEDPTDPANNCGPTHVWSGSTCVPKLNTDPAPGSPGSGGGSGGGPGGGSGGEGGGDGGEGGGDGGDPGGGTGGGGDSDDGESRVLGEGCQAVLECEGDPVQCAILRQQKWQGCRTLLGSKEVSDIQSIFSGDDNKLQERSVDVSGFFNEALSRGRFLSSSCPSPRSLSVMGKTIQFSWQPICDFATAMGPLVVALASLFFAVYVFRGIKG